MTKAKKPTMEWLKNIMDSLFPKRINYIRIKIGNKSESVYTTSGELLRVVDEYKDVKIEIEINHQNQ